MKIKEALGSVRELEQQFNKVRNVNTENVAARESTRVSSDAVKVDPAIDSSSDERRMKVAELKAAVSEGRYNPSSRDVAEAVIRDLFA